jgi:cytochrome c-type biogenesis protein CcmE
MIRKRLIGFGAIVAGVVLMALTTLGEAQANEDVYIMPSVGMSSSDAPVTLSDLG